MNDVAGAFDALEDAIEQERQALLSSDTDRITEAAEAKLAAVKAIEGINFGVEFKPRIEELAEKNRKNASLLMQRRQGVRWALEFFGFTEVDGAYSPTGARKLTAPSRLLAQG